MTQYDERTDPSGWAVGGVTFAGVMMILIGTMRAYGVVIVPLIVMFIGQYPARLGFYYLMYPHLGADALWWAYPVGSAISVLLTWWAYRYGGWRGKRHMAMAASPAG